MPSYILRLFQISLIFLMKLGLASSVFSSETNLIKGPLGLTFGEPIDVGKFCEHRPDFYWSFESTELVQRKENGLDEHLLPGRSNIFHLGLERASIRKKVLRNANLWDNVEHSVRQNAVLRPVAYQKFYSNSPHEKIKFYLSDYSRTFFESSGPQFGFYLPEIRDEINIINQAYPRYHAYAFDLKYINWGDGDDRSGFSILCGRNRRIENVAIDRLVELFGDGPINFLSDFRQGIIRFELIEQQGAPILTGVQITFLLGTADETLGAAVDNAEKKFKRFNEYGTWITPERVLISYKTRNCDVDLKESHCLRYQSTKHLLDNLEAELDYHKDVFERLVALSQSRIKKNKATTNTLTDVE